MRMLSLAVLTLFASATAQQKPPTISYAPVNIDGRSTPDGLVTINGKTYVSLDALKAGKVSVLSPGALGIYTFPVAKGITAKLSGCLGEWLTDGDTRLRINRQDVNDSQLVYLEAQTARPTVNFGELFQADKTYLLFRNGLVFDPTFDKFLKAASYVGDFSKGQTQTGYLQFEGMSFSIENPATKLVLRPTAGPPWSFDLTCSK